ncbi:oxygenase MpaB family protein [Sphingomonas sp. KR1UV-12]|uniref:Oxygenase MpaB family protein n=1 Tax=Sphingomonas aurea TaxID=3063994 RepID=A0ABT9EMB0_9SPHN|nr:oxygenase MpaB family protein [Sphingomonas sp. KR1UV-12]MDP1028090.1 oxygenase MpaB family protein [Sphingomonas sp. KR1UV-12]
MDMRQAIGDRVRGLVGSGELDLSRPAGDAGLFGPGSATWAVHGDFTSMMIGGIASLLVQMLHPGALAGVWDHSDFRRDMTGRLRRTAQFISVTSYGSTEAAERMIARVRGVHDRVRGTLPDGTPYSANDPALLAWVHGVEVDSFLRAHLRYRDPAMPMVRQDAYVDEMAVIAERLGAGDVPRSRAALSAYLLAMRPALRVDHRTREVARRLIDQPSPSRLNAPINAVMMQAGIELMPRWAARLHGLDLPAAGRPAIRLGALGVGHLMRWALR